MRFAFLAALLGILGSAVALACSTTDESPAASDAAAPSDAGTGDVTDAAPSDTYVPPPYPLNQVCAPHPEIDESCARCSYEKCCDTRATLFNDANPEGEALVVCLEKVVDAGDFADAAAQAGCFEQHPTEVQHFLEQASCKTHRCWQDCDAAPEPENKSCFDCLEANCLRPTVACDLVSDCFLNYTCGADCGASGACILDCLKRYPGAAAPTEKLAACGKQFCTSACGGK